MKDKIEEVATEAYTLMIEMASQPKDFTKAICFRDKWMKKMCPKCDKDLKSFGLIELEGESERIRCSACGYDSYEKTETQRQTA